MTPRRVRMRILVPLLLGLLALPVGYTLLDDDPGPGEKAVNETPSTATGATPSPALVPSPTGTPSPLATLTPTPGGVGADAGPSASVPPGAPPSAPSSAPPSAPVPTSPPTPKPSTGGFPNAGNTGVPSGVKLTKYDGPRNITRAGTVIDAKQIDGWLVVKAKNVTIKRSRVDGTVYVEKSGALTMVDSIVDGGESSNSAVSQYNLTLKRVEVAGARASVGCEDNCHVEDSWLHGQYIEPGSDWHGDGFLTNGGDNMTLRHNTLACDSRPTGAGGACSAALAAYGDFSPVTNLTVHNNLFVESPAGYCMYGGYDVNKPYGRGAKNIVVTDNVFERGSNGKCAAFGAVAGVAPSGSNGNVFSHNVWDDGKAVSD